MINETSEGGSGQRDQDVPTRFLWFAGSARILLLEDRPPLFAGLSFAPLACHGAQLVEQAVAPHVQPV